MDGFAAGNEPTIAAIAFPPAEVHARSAAIHAGLLAASAHVTHGNFAAIATSDLRTLFEMYDRHFFDGGLERLLAERHPAELSFRLSQRMTRVGGTTASFRRRGPDNRPLRGVFDYEITISTTLLFQSFHDLRRTVKVNGLVCHDRLEALQRVFEHELVHLLEMLVWGNSSCGGRKFKGIARRMFAHTEVRHDLVTQDERATASFGIAVGDTVEFQFEGRPRVGVVNRITRRATILVPDAAGPRYSDGRRYLKFYIPLHKLRKPSSKPGLSA